MSKEYEAHKEKLCENVCDDTALTASEVRTLEKNIDEAIGIAEAVRFSLAFSQTERGDIKDDKIDSVIGTSELLRDMAQEFFGQLSGKYPVVSFSRIVGFEKR